MGYKSNRNSLRNRLKRKCGKCNSNEDEHGHLHGGAIRLPSEYFGGDSGRYAADANVGRCPNSYGYTHAQSFGGNLPGNQVGPNMFAHPGGTGQQTGGRKRRTRRGKKARRSKRSKRGGAIRLPTEYFGGDSGRYAADANVGRCPNSYGYTHAQSFGGNLPGNQVGPNMFAHPGGSGQQTGGCSGPKSGNPRRRRRRRRSSRR